MAGRRAAAAAASAAAALTASGGATLTGSASAAFAPGGVPVSATNCALAAPGNGELGSSGGTRPAMSDDGRYVVFSTPSGNLLGRPAQADQYYSRGLLRCDTATGELALVAPPGRRRDDGDGNRANDVVVAPDPAEAASVSADGRRVAFATPQALLDADRNTASDVYVRDMTRPLSDPATAYELASSIDGRVQAPTYGAGGDGSASGHGALSNDGRRVAFTTRAASNVLGGAGLATPANQVLVRDLSRGTTTLVTRRLNGSGPATGSGTTPFDVVLSGDGRVVVWVGGNASEQTPFLPGEPEAPAHMLWRDVEAGGPTRRITGASDLDDPACDRAAPFSPSFSATGPCYGPLARPETVDHDGNYGGFGSPTVSDDGRTVAFAASPGVRGRSELDARDSEVFVADMAPDVSRKAATRRILSYGNRSGTATGVTLAADGRHLAFVNNSGVFPGLRPVGDFPTTPLGPNFNLHVVDLDTLTVERATRGWDGSDTTGGVGAYALDRTAATAAVQTGGDDGNLFRGDGNGAADVVLVRRASDPPPPVPPSAPPAPSASALQQLATTPPTLAARVPIFGALRVNKDLSVTVRVRVPAAGTLTAVSTARRARRTVKVGTDRERPRRAATVTARIVPSKRARDLLRRKPYTLSVRLKLTFKPTRGASSTVTRTYTLAGSRARAPRSSTGGKG